MNLLQILDDEIVKVNKYYYEGALKDNLNEENYFIANDLNDLVTIIRNYKNLTQEELANLINVSQNTIS